MQSSFLTHCWERVNVQLSSHENLSIPSPSIIAPLLVLLFNQSISQAVRICFRSKFWNIPRRYIQKLTLVRSNQKYEGDIPDSVTSNFFNISVNT